MELFDKYDHTIRSNGKEYLNEIISDEEYRRWFSAKKQGKIFILNKGRCGNGGTTGFIDYAKRKKQGLSIIVPNVSIVQSKEWDNDLCCLYGGVGDVKKTKPIRVSTWDKHKVVLEQFPQFGMDLEMDDTSWDYSFWVNSLLVVDEYHKLIDDSNFRTICAKVVRTIIETRCNVVLMSATPNYEFIDFLKEVSGKEVETYNIEYSNDIIKRLSWVEKGNKKLFDIISMIMKTNKQTVFFYNSVKRISELVNQMEDTKDVEVLCSKSNENKDVPCYSGEFNKDKKFHFLTSAYFTGMDIDEKIERVVIIGGNDEMVLSYSNKEIKQMLGRMRKGYEGAFVIHNGRKRNKRDFSQFISERDRSAFRVKNIREDARKNEMFIQEYLDCLYYNGVVEKMEGWDDEKSFRKMMSIYDEYEVKKMKIEDPDKFSRGKDISFGEYKKKRLSGEDVPYRYKSMCEKFIKMYGIERFETAGRNDIERYVKLKDMAGDVDLETLTNEEKYELFLGDGYYLGRFLMGVLDYLGEKCEYDVLEEKMREVFGSFCIYDCGNTAKKNGCVYLSIINRDLRKMSIFGDNKSGVSIRETNNLSPISDKKRMSNIRVSKKVSRPNQRTQCITDYLDDTAFASLMDIHSEFFTVLLTDPTLIPLIKGKTKWKELFDAYKKEQTMISEFYKDVPSSVRYPHKKDEMEKVDCIIVDIDDSISYDEFKRLYSDYEYVAYPTLSNPTPDNWTKFRVVFPLAQTLELPNDSLSVLKLLRRMVCKYEDKNHQLGAYVNKEQWKMRMVNEGNPVDISQDMVVYLESLVRSLKSFSFKNRKSKDGYFMVNNKDYFWSLEKGKEFFKEHDKDGERHSSLFIIKNRLSEEDCELFVDWLRTNYPDKVHHWLSHKRTVKMIA